MPHIKMRVDRAIQIMLDEPDTLGYDLFQIPAEDALGQLYKMKENGDVYIPTEGCPTFDGVKGCQCSDMAATTEAIKRNERF